MTYMSSTPTDVFYPESDGKPMADSTKQYQWIVVIKENLEILLEKNLDAFIAGDLLWYPIEGDNKTCLAPDVMVVLGRPKGDRGSYQQWKERNIGPQVVFEIMSSSNTQREMQGKRSFYATHGVDEFYIYDPDRLRLSGYIRQGGELLAIVNMEGWVSPSLGIRFSKLNGELEIFYPDGRRFLTSLELNRRAVMAEEERDRFEEERDLVTQERDQFAQRAIEAEQERDRLMEQLRSLGINLKDSDS
jgi:Uma2 family endonuclease